VFPERLVARPFGAENHFRAAEDAGGLDNAVDLHAAAAVGFAAVAEDAHVNVGHGGSGRVPDLHGDMKRSVARREHAAEVAAGQENSARGHRRKGMAKRMANDAAPSWFEGHGVS
jgi:hypothetical protein